MTGSKQLRNLHKKKTRASIQLKYNPTKIKQKENQFLKLAFGKDKKAL